MPKLILPPVEPTKFRSDTFKVVHEQCLPDTYTTLSRRRDRYIVITCLTIIALGFAAIFIAIK